MVKQNSINPKLFFANINKTIKHGDVPWQWLLLLVTSLLLLLVVSIGLILWSGSRSAQTIFGINFFLPTSDSSWDPVNEHFQAWSFIYGTLITSITAIALALPIGLGIAIFLSELCPKWLEPILSWLIELLAAIPSVVFGLWGIFVFLPDVVEPVGNYLGLVLGSLPVLGAIFKGPIPASGASRLAASLILTIMIIPTIAAVTRDVFKAIPTSQREASLALGATQWETIWQVLIPYSMSGILGATILGMGRAVGETMAVTMVIGNSIESSTSLLRPGYTMSSVIANEFAEAVSQMHAEALLLVGLVLFVMTLFLNLIARFLVWQVAKRGTQETK